MVQSFAQTNLEGSLQILHHSPARTWPPWCNLLSGRCILHTKANINLANSVEGVSNIRLLALIWRQQTACCKVDLGQSAVNIDHRHIFNVPWDLECYSHNASWLESKARSKPTLQQQSVTHQSNCWTHIYVAWWLCSCSIPHTIVIVLYYTVVYCARSTVTPTGNNTEGIIQGHLMGPDLAPADCLL